MRYDAEHKERTRQRILAEAASAIRTKGPDRVGVAEIMAELGLTHGGFYAHFGSKDELVAAAIALMFDQAIARFERKTAGLTPAEGLRAYVDWYLSAAHRDAPGRGCALAALSGDLPRLPAAARARFTEGAARLPVEIARLLRGLGHADAEALAVSTISELIGALALARAISDPARSEEILRVSREAIRARLGLGAYA